MVESIASEQSPLPQLSIGGVYESCVCPVPKLWPSSWATTMMSQLFQLLSWSGLGKEPERFALTPTPHQSLQAAER